MKTQKELKQIEEKINKYYQIHSELEKPNMYCKECGKFLIYDNADIHLNERKHKNNKHDIISSGHTFLSTKIYEGKTYHLCRCKECVGKKFPDIYNVKFLYAAKFAKYTQYAYDVPDNIFNTYTKERQALTKDKMIKLYGEEIGLEKWNAYRQKQSITNTFEYKQEKYGMTKEEFDEYNKSRSSTKELFIKRHGIEEGTELWNEYCERQRYTTSLEYFIEKYGEDKGYEKYMLFDVGRVSFGGVSHESDKLFNSLIQNNIFKNHDIYFNLKNREYDVKGYRLDFYDKTLNLVIEFYGDYWHMNPYIYKENDTITVWDKITIAKNKWDLDKQRIKFVQNELNCNIIIVWEAAYKLNNDKTINDIVDIINNKLDENNIIEINV